MTGATLRGETEQPVQSDHARIMGLIAAVGRLQVQVEQLTERMGALEQRVCALASDHRSLARRWRESVGKLLDAWTRRLQQPTDN